MLVPAVADMATNMVPGDSNCQRLRPLEGLMEGLSEGVITAPFSLGPVLEVEQVVDDGNGFNLVSNSPVQDG